MKRLVAIAVNTEQLGPSTQDEIKWISEKDKNLNESTWHNFEKRDNRGSWGNVYYYEGNEGQIYVYIVDSFCFLDTDKLSPNEINKVAYVATRYDLVAQQLDTRYHYVEIKTDVNRKELNLNDRLTNTIEFEGDYILTLLPGDCNTPSKIWKSLVETFKDEEKVKNGFAHENHGKPLEEIPV